MTNMELEHLPYENMCEGNRILEVQLVNWDHENMGIFASGTNTKFVFERYLTPPLGTSPYAVAVDGYTYSFFANSPEFNDDDIHLFQEGFEKTGNIFVAGDFISYYALEKFFDSQETKEKWTISLLAAGATLVGGYYVGKNLQNFTRREFIKALGVTALSGALLYGGLRFGLSFADDRAEALNRCDYNNPLLAIDNLTDDPVESDKAIRTGLIAGKMSNLPNTFFLERGKEVSSLVELLGLDHGMFNSLKAAKEVANNYPHYADLLIKRDISYMKNMGLTDSQVSKFMVPVIEDMAAVVPFDVVSPQNNSPVLNLMHSQSTGEGVYFDPAIIGFKTAGMSPQERKSKLIGRIFDMSWDISGKHFI